MCLELVDYNANERRGFWINSLGKMLDYICYRKIPAHHKTEFTPVIKEVTVDIYAVRLAQVLGYQPPDGRQVLFFQTIIILNILQV